MRAYKNILTTFIVLTVIAIVIAVGLFAWDEFGLGKRIEQYFSSSLFGDGGATRIKPRGDAEITVEMQKTEKATENVNILFEDYFTLWYSSLCCGERENMNSFYEYQTDEYLTDCLWLDYQAGLVGISPSLFCDAADVTVTYTASGEDHLGGAQYDITVTARLKSGGKIVRAETVKHIFSVDEGFKGAKIVAHSSDSDAAMYMLGVLNETISTAGWTRSDLSYTYLEKYINKALSAALDKRRTATERLADGLSGDTAELPAVEYGYDREKAVAYALSHMSSPDTESFGSYPDNAANFASQCVYAGGIPMDMQGDAALQWKWYSEKINTKREHSGCSESWYVPQKLYDYLAANTGFGVSAVCGAPLGSLEKGDLLFLYRNGEISDVVMITDMVVKNGEISDFAVADEYEVLLGGLAFDDVVGVKLVGYNTVNDVEQLS